MPRSDMTGPDGETGVPSALDRGLGATGHFGSEVLVRAAQLYYLQDATQAEVAHKLGTSRATVSRILAEARRQGIVRIEVVPPGAADGVDEDLGVRLARQLGLAEVFLSAPMPPAGGGRSTEDLMGGVLAPAVGRALQGVGLEPGDVLLVSSGRTMYEVARSELPPLPGVMVAPTVGGNDQPEGWYQTNEITRLMASQVGGRAVYLFAPALPGPDLYQTLHADPAIQRVLHLWPQADCVLMGLGAPPSLRAEMPAFVPRNSPTLREAVGDLCSRFFDREGRPVDWDGADRLIALELAELARIPARIAVAVGPGKVTSIITAARAGYFNQLVTDPATAGLVLGAVEGR